MLLYNRGAKMGRGSGIQRLLYNSKAKIALMGRISCIQRLLYNRKAKIALMCRISGIQRLLYGPETAVLGRSRLGRLLWCMSNMCQLVGFLDYIRLFTACGWKEREGNVSPAGVENRRGRRPGDRHSRYSINVGGNLKCWWF